MLMLPVYGFIIWVIWNAFGFLDSVSGKSFALWLFGLGGALLLYAYFAETFTQRGSGTVGGLLFAIYIGTAPIAFVRWLTRKGRLEKKVRLAVELAEAATVEASVQQPPRRIPALYDDPPIEPQEKPKTEDSELIVMGPKLW